MKKSYILIALAMVAALTTVSCKCSSKKSQEPTQEEVQKMKQALADSVLAEIDALAEQYFDASNKSFRLKEVELTEAEKMVKPDYLLDPSVAGTLITKFQKVNALAIYSAELGIRKMYDMPTDEIKEVLVKLAADVNHPIDVDFLTSSATTSEKLKREYEVCKERGDIAYFWQFEEAIITETEYIIAQNPKLFINKISNEMWLGFYYKRLAKIQAIKELAEYDDEMAIVRDISLKYKFGCTQEDLDKLNQSKELRIQFRIKHKDKYIARRNALLQ